MRGHAGLRTVVLAPSARSGIRSETGLIASSCATTTRIATLNRIADAFGTDLEPEMPRKPEGWAEYS